MKVRLKRDWLGFNKGYELEDKDGVFEFTYHKDDVREEGRRSSDVYASFNKGAILDNPALFEVVEDEGHPEMKNRDEVQKRLNQIYKDIDLLKDLKNGEQYIHTLENMAYILEWTLGNVK